MTKMYSPNDLSAPVYDVVSLPQKPEETTAEELELIKSLVTRKDKILDIACGTGRHLIPLLQDGYQVDGIDNSREMLRILSDKLKVLSFKKQTNPIIIHSDILHLQLTTHNFKLICLFWNAFNEICLTEESATVLLEKLKKALKPGGKILINIDDAELVDPANFDFETKIKKNGKEYNLHWETIEYDKKTNTAKSLEQITIYDIKSRREVHKSEAEIVQRYWRLSELDKIFKKVGLVYEVRKLKTSGELYLIVNN